ncbi:hypothetical protein DID88_007982 [Monilinia fructigena]|uniref:Vesicle tethering protein Uso1/P115-like head domain-containing protein n=1 Tax=Monilinia fructigena TaxID=38457 RepID=A0A395J3V0_9HELO|nr:hypothetical protein DID88_007982 [Monilinia fructigena]
MFWATNSKLLTTLLQPLDSHISSDPYRYWFASVLLFHLIFEDAEAKSMAMGVAEGDAENGEEVVVTCIPVYHCQPSAWCQKVVDERVLVAYLMLLCGWLFEDPDANDRAKQDYQRQLEQAQKAAESNAEIARAEHDRAIQDYQRQLEHVQKTAEANAERVRRRTDAEIADLKSKIEKLEADLDKANKNHVQDLQTAHDEYTTSKAEQDARLKRAEENAKEAEERAGTAHGSWESVSDDEDDDEEEDEEEDESGVD